MKEFPFSLGDWIKAGLRSDYRNGVNTPGLVECMNARPTPKGLLPPEEVTMPFTFGGHLQTIDWPFPQYFRGRSHSYLVTRETFYEVEDDLTLTHRLDQATDSIWTWADYGDFVLFSDGVNSVYRNTTTGNLALTWDYITANGICDYKGQIIAAGLEDDNTRVGWSEIGSAVFEVSRSNVAGYMPSPYGGDIYNAKRLGDYVVVYGENGVFALAPSSETPTFGMVELIGVGVKWKGAIGGDVNTQYFVSVDDELWKITKKPEVGKLGYSEFFGDDEIMGSFDPKEGDTYLCSNTHGYIVTSTGVGETAKPVTSVGRVNGNLYGCFRDLHDGEMRIRTDNVNLGQPGMKTVKVVSIKVHTPNDIWARVDWVGNMDPSKVSITPWRRVNSSGWVVLPMSGDEFRIGVKIGEYNDSYISDLDVRWQLSDKRAIRGIY